MSLEKFMLRQMMNECQFLKDELFLVRSEDGDGDAELDKAVAFVEREIVSRRFSHGTIASCN
jgi:hypothetical protein